MAYSPAFSQAIEILIYIEMKSAKEYYKYLSIQKIAEGLAIPVPSVKRLIGMLKKSGLILSKTGITGGLALGRSIDQITLYEILLSVEGQQPLFAVYEGFDVESFPDREIVKPILARSKALLQEIDDTMVDGLKARTLVDLMEVG